MRTIEQTRMAQECGADAALVVTPYYYRPLPSGLKAHYEAVVDACDLPVVLYNVPSRTAVDLPVETVAELSRLEQVVAIKEATPGPERIRLLLEACGDRLAVLSGDDDSCAESMLAGASGVISVAANIAPALLATLCKLARAGNREEAMALRERLVPLFRQLGIETNPIPVKWAAYELDLAGPGIRLPLLPLEERYRAGLRTSLEQLGLLDLTEH
jgi:4-hydroxy-tetrahydrodipicolinate synthase